MLNFCALDVGTESENWRLATMDRSYIYEGKRILVVEDDLFLGMDICEALEREGGIVYGPVIDRDSAEKVASFGDIDGAIIDFKLGHKNSLKLAQFCFENDIPCICYTGDRKGACNANMDAFAPVIEKPVITMELLSTLAKMM